MPAIEFEGLGQNLIEGVRQATDSLKAMRSEVNGVNADIRKQATENAQQEQKLAQTIDATADSLADVRRETLANEKATKSSTEAAAKNAKAVDAQGNAVEGLVKDLNQVPPAANKAASGIAKVGNEAQAAGRKGGILGSIKGIFSGIAQGAKDAASNVGSVFSNLTSGITSAIPGAGQLTSVLGGLAGPIGAAAALAVGLVTNLSRLDSVKVLVDGLGIAFDGLLNRMTSLRGIGSIITGTGIAEEAVRAAALAKIYDQIEDGQNRVNIANAEAEKLLAGLNQQLRDRTKTEEERLAIADKITQIEQQRSAQEIKLLRDELGAAELLAQGELNSLGERSDANKKAVAERLATLRNAEAASIQLTETVERRRNSILEQGSTERDEILQKEIANRKKAQADLAALEQDLSRRNTTAAQATADPLERLQRVREAGKAEVELLEEKLRAANAALGRSNELTIDQEQQLANIRLAIQAQYEKDRQALELKYAADRIALIEDTGEQERAAFDLQLQARIKVLTEAGATEIEIAAFVQRERDKFRGGQVEKAIAEEEAIANARIDAMEKGAESELDFERRKEALKLDVREEFARARLDQIKDDTSKEAELTRLQLQGIINEVEAAREKLKDSAPKSDIFSLLGISGISDEDKESIKQSLEQIGAMVLEFASANIAAQQANVDAQIEATDQIIDDQQRRRDELQSLLDDALKEQAAGRANNVDSIREEIKATQDAEAQALEQRKQAIGERRRLAQQQALIDSASQVSSLATAAAGLFKDGALKGGIAGTIGAIAFAISLIATFASLRAKVKAAASSDAPSFAKGTKFVDRENRYPDGVDTVPAYLDKGEAVIPKKQNKRYAHLIDGIVEGDQAKVQQAAIRELMLGANIQLDQDKVKEVVRERETVNTIAVVQASQTDKAVIKELRELRETVESFKTQERVKPSTSAQDGRTVTKTPTRIDTKRNG